MGVRFAPQTHLGGLLCDCCKTPATARRHFRTPHLLGQVLTQQSARAGSRTLNLGIKSLSTASVVESQGGSERLNRTRIYDATVSESLSEDQGVSRSRCQIRCRARAPALLSGHLDLHGGGTWKIAEGQRVSAGAGQDRSQVAPWQRHAPVRQLRLHASRVNQSGERVVKEE